MYECNRRNHLFFALTVVLRSNFRNKNDALYYENVKGKFSHITYFHAVKVSIYHLEMKDFISKTFYNLK